VQGGHVDLGYTKSYIRGGLPGTTIGKIKDSGMAGRLFAGLTFNKYVATEVGYLRAPKVKVSDITYQGVPGIGFSFNQYFVDLALKGILPINDTFSLFAKVGVAWVHGEKLKVTIQGFSVPVDQEEDDEYVPTSSVGMAYHFNEHLFADISYTQFFKRHDVPEAHFYGIGLGYKFGALA
jgi:opacity protein-like surface antigen